jgi:hypothetical protein
MVPPGQLSGVLSGVNNALGGLSLGALSDLAAQLGAQSQPGGSLDDIASQGLDGARCPAGGDR